MIPSASGEPKTEVGALKNVAGLSTCVLLAASSPAAAQLTEGTFSIIVRDTATGELGMAVQSKTLAVGSRTITIKGGVAVIAHQSASNPMYGAIGLELLATGMTPQQALDMMLRSDEGRDSRQVAILDVPAERPRSPVPAPVTGRAIAAPSTSARKGNILAGAEVVEASRARSNRPRVRWRSASWRRSTPASVLVATFAGRNLLRWLSQSPLLAPRVW